MRFSMHWQDGTLWEQIHIGSSVFTRPYGNKCSLRACEWKVLFLYSGTLFFYLNLFQPSTRDTYFENYTQCQLLIISRSRGKILKLYRRQKMWEQLEVQLCGVRREEAAFPSYLSQLQRSSINRESKYYPFSALDYKLNLPPKDMQRSYLKTFLHILILRP